MHGTVSCTIRALNHQYSVFQLLKEFADVKEVMSNLEYNTCHWRQRCEKNRSADIKEDDDEN